MYETLKFIHVLMAIVWVGGGVLIQLLALRAVRSKEPGRLAAFSGDAEWVGLRVFMPASLLALVTGIWAAADADIDFGQAWISIGFLGVLVSFFVGMGFLGPESGRIKALVQDRGPDDPAVRQRVRRIMAVSRIELLVLVVVVWAMVAKPG